MTHDVDEALLLADRVLVLDHGRIALDTAVDAPRPRRHDSAAFIAQRATLLAAFGVTEQPGAQLGLAGTKHSQ